MNFFNSNINCEKFGYKIIKINDLYFDKQKDIIGKGAFSFVYKASYKNNFVAFKTMLDKEYFSNKNITVLEHEIKILKSINHPNIIGLLGVSFGVREVGIILEYCEGGTLADIIHKWRIKDLLMCLKYLQQICDGMSYLHNDSKKNTNIYIHRDLKPQNILIKEKICVKRNGEFTLYYKMSCNECEGKCSFIGNVTLKIADFGLSKVNNESCSQIKGTIPYMAPEAHQKICSTKSDVYSFSVLLWEMLHLEFPTQGRNRENILEDQRLGKQILKMSSSLPPFLVKIFEECHSHNFVERPSFYEIGQLIIVKLGKLMEKLEKDKINIYYEILKEQNTNIVKINDMLQINKKERLYEIINLEKDYEKLRMKISDNSYLSTILNKQLVENNRNTVMNKCTNSENGKKTQSLIVKYIF
uniref:Protein kinase domain-containing protein n=1 Tax=Strongyloides papillosus TaxID=174720 RepID=A0A0N5BF47_STREA